MLIHEFQTSRPTRRKHGRSAKQEANRDARASAVPAPDRAKSLARRLTLI